MQQEQTFGRQQASDGIELGRVIPGPHMLEHTHRDDLVKAPLQIAIVLKNQPDR